MFKKMQGVAQVVGFVMLGTLALLGAINLLSANPTLAAFKLRAFQAPQAIEPAFVSYQGMLYDDLGVPLSGAYTLTFRLYDDAVAPLSDAFWSEDAIVTVREGHFSVLLGETSPITHALFAQPDTYIGIQVNGYDELLPRQRFATAPYAFYATRASGLTAPDGDPDNAVTVDDEGNVSVINDLYVADALTSSSLDVGGTISGGTISGSSLDVSDSLMANTLSLDGGTTSIEASELNLLDGSQFMGTMFSGWTQLQTPAGTLMLFATVNNDADYKADEEEAMTLSPNVTCVAKNLAVWTDWSNSPVNWIQVALRVNGSTTPVNCTIYNPSSGGSTCTSGSTTYTIAPGSKLSIAVIVQGAGPSVSISNVRFGFQCQ